MPAPACPRHQTLPRSASGGSWGLRSRLMRGGPAPGGRYESPGVPTDSGREAVSDQPSPQVPAESLARPELRGAHEPGTPNFGPRDAMPKLRPATYGSISEPRVPGPRRCVPSSPGVPQPPPEPPVRPSSRPRKTHQSATARSRARKPRTSGAGQPPAALAPDTCHVGRRPG